MNLIPWRRRGSNLPYSTDTDDFFSRLWGDGESGLASHLPEVFQHRAMPAVNVAETEDNFCITVDCPGLDEKDIQVEAMAGNLLISGERKWEDEKQGKEFRRVESQYGKFERSVALPDNARIDPGEIEANYKQGVLTITVPKIERTPASRIPVHAG